jgi:glycosyltransferase involved in cell wall biosynthesis
MKTVISEFKADTATAVESTPRADTVPFVSVIMPVRNEEKSIEECLRRLVNQTYRKDRYEIIIVDGLSEDRTRDIVQEHAIAEHKKSGLRIRLLDNAKRCLYPALNIGVKAARGDIVMRVDGRSICPFDYIEKCVNTLLETGAHNVGGMQKAVGRNLTQKAVACAMSHPFGVGNAQYRVGKTSGCVDTVYLGCFRRDVFDRVGLFDENSSVISEDSDMNRRIREAGGKVFLNCDIKVGYYPRDTLKEHVRIYFIWGKARAAFFLKHKGLTSWRQLVPPLFTMTILLGLLALPFSGFVRLGFSFLLLFYLLCDFVVAGILAVRERNMNLLPLLLLIFPAMHFAWGAGFWTGLLARNKGENYWR